MLVSRSHISPDRESALNRNYSNDKNSKCDKSLKHHNLSAAFFSTPSSYLGSNLSRLLRPVELYREDSMMIGYLPNKLNDSPIEKGMSGGYTTNKSMLGVRDAPGRQSWHGQVNQICTYIWFEPCKES